MSLIAAPQDCCRPCPEPVVENIPGTPGTDGTPGATGEAGTNAWTTVTAPFAMPAEGTDVTVEVADSSWVALSEYLFLGDPAAAAKGTFRIVGIPDGTHLTARNLADTAAGHYTDNSAPGTAFPTGTVVTPAGQQGPDGVSGGSGAISNGKYLVNQLVGGLPSAAQDLSILNTGLMMVTTTTGAVTSVTIGITASAIAPVDSGAALTAGQIVQVVAGGLKSDTAANTRTLLGLGSIATQAASSVTITGGTIAGTPISGSTGSFTTLGASGDTTLAGRLFTPSTAIQTLAAGNTISPNARKVRVAGSGGPITLTSTPTITNPVADGQRLLIQGTNDTNTITLQDEATSPGSKLRLGASTRVLGKGDTIELEWDQVDGVFYEVSFTSQV